MQALQGVTQEFVALGARGGVCTMMIFAITADHEGHAIGFPLYPIGFKFHNVFLAI
jgi:hypothetical protein